MSRSKRPYGPPKPNLIALRLERTIETATDPVDVIDAALRLRDARKTILPVGGGLLVGDAARVHAEDVFAALIARGMLKPAQLELEVTA